MGIVKCQNICEKLRVKAVTPNRPVQMLVQIIRFVLRKLCIGQILRQSLHPLGKGVVKGCAISFKCFGCIDIGVTFVCVVDKSEARILSIGVKLDIVAVLLRNLGVILTADDEDTRVGIGKPIHGGGVCVFSEF